jgi:hypothetical protein
MNSIDEIVELYKRDVDVTLIEESLRRTVEERLRALEEFERVKWRIDAGPSERGSETVVRLIPNPAANRSGSVDIVRQVYAFRAFTSAPCVRSSPIVGFVEKNQADLRGDYDSAIPCRMKTEEKSPRRCSESCGVHRIPPVTSGPGKPRHQSAKAAEQNFCTNLNQRLGDWAADTLTKHSLRLRQPR